MFTASTRVTGGLAVLALTAGVGYFLGSDQELYGTVLLAGLLLVAAFLVTVAVAHRDHDAPSDTPSDALAPRPGATPSSVWPLFAALGVGLLGVGAVEGKGWFLAGAAVLAVALLEGAVQGWSEQISDDPAHNVAVRNRLLLPLEIPLGATVAAGVAAISISRVLLAVSEIGAVVVAGVVSTLILIVGSVIAFRPRVPAGAMATISVLGVVAVLGGGVAGIAAGEREFEVHGAEHGAADDHGEEGDDHGEPGVGTDGEGEGEHDEPVDDGDVIELTIVAENIEWDLDVLNLEAGQPAIITVENLDSGVPHNLVIDAGDAGVFETEIENGPVTQTLDVQIDEPGTYEFVCIVHPNMVGEVVVS